jgi:hypothetical protein
MGLRRGVYFFDRHRYREDSANFFIGYQIAGMTLSGAFFMASGLALAVPATIILTIVATTDSGKERLVDTATAAVPPLAWTVLGIALTVGFQSVVNLVIFFSGPRGNKWLRHRWWYALYDYNMIFSNTLVGIAVMFSRFVLWLVLGIFCLGRIDLTLLPGPGQLESLDLGYRTYVALVRQDHRYNNPVCVVFFETITEHLGAFRRRRARARLRKHIRLMWQLGAVLNALRERAGLAPLKPEDQTALRQNINTLVEAFEKEQTARKDAAEEALAKTEMLSWRSVHAGQEEESQAPFQSRFAQDGPIGWFDIRSALAKTRRGQREPLARTRKTSDSHLPSSLRASSGFVHTSSGFVRRQSSLDLNRSHTGRSSTRRARRRELTNTGGDGGVRTGVPLTPPPSPPADLASTLPPPEEDGADEKGVEAVAEGSPSLGRSTPPPRTSGSSPLPSRGVTPELVPEPVGGGGGEEEEEAAASDEPLSLEEIAFRDALASIRRRLVRNRWQLARMLIANPALRQYRAHALRVDASRKEELLKPARPKPPLGFWQRLRQLVCCRKEEARRPRRPRPLAAAAARRREANRLAKLKDQSSALSDARSLEELELGEVSGVADEPAFDASPQDDGQSEHGPAAAPRLRSSSTRDGCVVFPTCTEASEQDGRRSGAAGGDEEGSAIPPAGALRGNVSRGEPAKLPPSKAGGAALERARIAAMERAILKRG